MASHALPNPNRGVSVASACAPKSLHIADHIQPVTCCAFSVWGRCDRCAQIFFTVMVLQGQGNTGTANQGEGNTGTANQGQGNTGTANQGAGNTGTANQVGPFVPSGTGASLLKCYDVVSMLDWAANAVVRPTEPGPLSGIHCCPPCWLAAGRGQHRHCQPGSGQHWHC